VPKFWKGAENGPQATERQGGVQRDLRTEAKHPTTGIANPDPFSVRTVAYRSQFVFTQTSLNQLASQISKAAV
jgi:hypothetical protein